MEQIRVARSFIAADSLAEIVAENYDLDGPITSKMFSKLLRTQDNDHYRVNAGTIVMPCVYIKMVTAYSGKNRTICLRWIG